MHCSDLLELLHLSPSCQLSMFLNLILSINTFKLFRVTWWTRHAVLEPELSDDEDEEPERAPENQMSVEEPQYQTESKYCNFLDYSEWFTFRYSFRRLMHLNSSRFQCSIQVRLRSFLTNFLISKRGHLEHFQLYL